MKSIAEFPTIRPIILDDKPLLDRFFEKYQPTISEFTFTNLFAWRHAYDFCLSSLDGFLLVIWRQEEIWQAFDPVGDDAKKKEVMRRCFSLVPKGKTLSFVRIPEKTAKLFEGDDEYRTEEDRDSFDYVYRTQDLIELKGKNFDGKRNFIKRFKDAYPFTYKKLTQSEVARCLSFEEEWCLAKDCQHTAGLIKERRALNEILKNFELLKLIGGVIEVEGKIEAVTLGEALNPQTFVVHIEKANGGLIGIYQAINQMFCEREAKNFKYINREQDLGVAGLRQSKESYHPHHMVKKYCLSLANS